MNETILSAVHFFLDKSGDITKNEVKLGNVFNKYFVNMVYSMVITNNHNFLSNTETSEDLFRKDYRQIQK